MIYRVTGALTRAFLVAAMVATPSLVLPSVSDDTTQIVALIAIFSAGLIYSEYASAYPGLIEFRDAPPFNRIRFVSLFACVIALSVVSKGVSEPTTLTQFATVLGQRVSAAMDFPFSPVRLIGLMLEADAGAELTALVRASAGLAYILSLVTLAIFVLLIRIMRWPYATGEFNVWVNLPTFDPTAGGDVVLRLKRDARINLLLGLALPFAIPVVISAAQLTFEAVTLESSQTLIWTVTAWAFLPTSLLMRGVAMGRIADIIAERRRRSLIAADRAAAKV